MTVAGFATFAYQPAAAGQRLSATESGTGIAGGPRTINYAYDPLYRLKKEEIGTGTPNGNIIYDDQPGYTDSDGFDRVGNRRSRGVSTTALINAGITEVSGQAFDVNDRLDTNADPLDANGNYDENGNTKIETLPEPAISPTGTHPDQYDFDVTGHFKTSQRWALQNRPF